MTPYHPALSPVEALIPYVRNSRTHDDAQVAQIAASIAEFGMVGAIVVRDGVIAKGHGTLMAVRKLYGAGRSLYPAPGEQAGVEPYPAGTVPVLDVSGWTDAQFRAYVIADNKLALNAGWDNDLLKSEIEALADEGFDVGLTGWTLDDLAELAEADLEDLDQPSDGDEKSDKLKWGKNTVPLTDSEADKLQAALDRHVEIFGMSNGFVEKLLRV